MSSPRPPAPNVVVFGSANVDLVMTCDRLPAPGRTELAPSYDLLPGGKGANQAHAARRVATALAALEAASDARQQQQQQQHPAPPSRVDFVGAVGEDAFATILTDAFADVGVGVAHLKRVADAPTACAAVIVERDAGENQICVGGGANLRARAESLRDAAFADDDDDRILRPLVADRTVLLTQMEVPLEETAAAIRLARTRGAFVAHNAAPGGCVPPETLRQLDALVVNEHELQEVFEREHAESGMGVGALGKRTTPAEDDDDDAASSARAMATRLSQWTGAIVIVTLGAKGAICCLAATEETRPALAHLPPFSMRVSAAPLRGPGGATDTTGAGDAFAGAFAASVARGGSLGDALREASACGAATCEAYGARSGALEEAVRTRRGEEVRIAYRGGFGFHGEELASDALDSVIAFAEGKDLLARFKDSRIRGTREGAEEGR